MRPSSASVAEIEACAEQNLKGRAGVVGFAVDAIDRSGVATTSRAELRWRRPANEKTRLLLTVSEPAQTAGTALLMIDRDAEEPEFFVRLPEMKKVKKIRSRRLRGPVLGTDFSYEDLGRLRDPVARAQLVLLGTTEVAGRPAWVLETIPEEEDGSEYSRVLTYVDESICLPVRIELFEAKRGGEHRLRKRLDASVEAIRPVGEGEARILVPHEFVMNDLERETRTVVRIEGFETAADLPAALFTRAGLGEGAPAEPAP